MKLNYFQFGPVNLRYQLHNLAVTQKITHTWFITFYFECTLPKLHKNLIFIPILLPLPPFLPLLSCTSLMDIIFYLRYYYCCCFNSQYSLNYVFTLSDALHWILWTTHFSWYLLADESLRESWKYSFCYSTIYCQCLSEALLIVGSRKLFTHTSVLCSFPSLWTFHQHACSSQNQKSSLVLECMALAIYFKGNTSNTWDSWECLCPELLEIWYCSQDFVP